MAYKTAVFALLAIYLQQGSAIKCYVCDSLTELSCEDNVESLQQEECTPDVFNEEIDAIKRFLDPDRLKLATKYGSPILKLKALVPDTPPPSVFACTKRVYQDGDKKVLFRGCGAPKTGNNNECQQLLAKKDATFCDTCDTDGCNGASGLAPSAALFLVVAALATVFARL